MFVVVVVRVVLVEDVLIPLNFFVNKKIITFLRFRLFVHLVPCISPFDFIAGANFSSSFFMFVTPFTRDDLYVFHSVVATATTVA